MTRTRLLARRVALAASVACVFAGTLSAWPTVGEARKKPAGAAAGPSAQGPGPAAQGGDDASQKVAAAEAAKKAYDAGLKDFAGGRFQSSIDQLSTAVKSGSLTPTQMAKALVTRGQAYKKTNKPGQAISDLTSAVWIKNGLSPAEQKSALAERSEAYQMAGLQDTGSTPDQRAIGTPSAAPAAASTASNVVANPAPGPNAGSAGLSAGAIAEAAGEQKAAAKSGDGTSATVSSTSGSVGGETSLQAAATPGLVSEPKPASSGIGSIFGFGQSSPPAEPIPAAPSTGSSFTQSVTSIPGNVSGFFSNMFGGGSSAPPPDANQQLATAATTPPAVAAPETSSWSSTTKVAVNVGIHTGQQTIKAEKASYAPEAAPKAGGLIKGKFKIHIAALRSKAEADALAQKLVAEHGAELGNHYPIVDEAVIGSMGTFYRVRIGGYASQDEPRSLCNKLRTSGLDCLVVTN